MTAIVATRAELAAARAGLRGRTAVVMTMGALHDGHTALIRAAGRCAESVVVTVFVNPLQFGAGEDLDRYPRSLPADIAMCEAAGAAVVFTPDVDEMYPCGRPLVRVHAGPLGDRLEGASRPGHFDGVLTVVTKLLHLTRPDVAVFGEKDAQQLALVRQLVADLDLPTEVVGVPTVREPDGLAMSSRNRYLSQADREAALALSRALRAGEQASTGGPSAVVAAALGVLEGEPRVDLDYLELLGDPGWQPVTPSTRRARLLVAARVAGTRLIDNVLIDLGTP